MINKKKQNIFYTQNNCSYYRKLFQSDYSTQLTYELKFLKDDQLKYYVKNLDTKKNLVNNRNGT